MMLLKVTIMLTLILWVLSTIQVAEAKCILLG
jgi:hypothetical protein